MKREYSHLQSGWVYGQGARWRSKKRKADTQVGSKWVIIVTLAVVVAAFLGGSSYAEWRANRTHDLTAEIATNESPSILYLAAARAELRDLQRLLNTHVLLASTGRPAPTQPLKDMRDRLRENLQHYFALPALADERELWQRIDKELTDVDVLAGQIMQATAQRPLSWRRRSCWSTSCLTRSTTRPTRSWRTSS